MVKNYQMNVSKYKKQRERNIEKNKRGYIKRVKEIKL